MNPLFLTVVFLVLVVNVVMNLKKLRNQPLSLRSLCWILYTCSFSLFVGMALQVDIPMPTRFFINHVSPWVFSLLNSSASTLN